MANKVVHLSDEVHNRAKQHCTKLGIRMSVWVAELIKDGIQKAQVGQKFSDTFTLQDHLKGKNESGVSAVTPVETGKNLPKFSDSSEDLASKPPFWDAGSS